MNGWQRSFQPLMNLRILVVLAERASHSNPSGVLLPCRQFAVKIGRTVALLGETIATRFQLRALPDAD